MHLEYIIVAVRSLQKFQEMPIKIDSYVLVISNMTCMIEKLDRCIHCQTTGVQGSQQKCKYKNTMVFFRIKHRQDLEKTAQLVLGNHIDGTGRNMVQKSYVIHFRIMMLFYSFILCFHFFLPKIRKIYLYQDIVKRAACKRMCHMN